MELCTKHARRAALLSRRRFLTRGVIGGAAGLALPLEMRHAPPRFVAPTARTKAIYMNPLITNDAAGFFGLVDLIERTELNALVVDVKEQGVYYDTAVDLYRETNAVAPLLDVAGLLNTLRQHEISAIARVVVFKDQEVALARPDLAVRDTLTGEPWLDDGGYAWLNPFAREVWDAAAALSVELATLGFDEIQLDYVRFPSDGDLTRLDYGQPVTEAIRAETIAAFVDHCRAALAPTGAKLAADVFGFTLILDDIGIGQNVNLIGPLVDYVCPMVYPSHFPNGSIDVPGHPNDYPYETIAISLAAGAAKVAPGKLRPWLQDFTLPGMSAYGAAEVRAQIDAAEAAGSDGWMVWDPNNVYHDAAFRPA